MVAAGIAGFRKNPKSPLPPSAVLLRQWLLRRHFVWLVTEEILDEYKRVLNRLKVRRSLIGMAINEMRRGAEPIEVGRSNNLSPDPDDDPFCDCAEMGRADVLFTLNPKDFPQERLSAKIVVPR